MFFIVGCGSGSGDISNPDEPTASTGDDGGTGDGDGDDDGTGDGDDDGTDDDPVVPVVACPDTSTEVLHGGFTYCTLSYDGKIWLDRNLGATKVAGNLTDYEGYGYLYQWGRKADGHEIINHTATGSTAQNGITETKADNPTHSDFIKETPPGPGEIYIEDWRINRDDNLWNTTGTGPNEVCPAGYRLPTKAEFESLGDLHTSTNFDDKIQLPYAGERHHFIANVYPNVFGSYATSTTNGSQVYYLSIRPDGPTSLDPFSRSRGSSVRCIQH